MLQAVANQSRGDACLKGTLAEYLASINGAILETVVYLAIQLYADPGFSLLALDYVHVAKHVNCRHDSIATLLGGQSHVWPHTCRAKLQ